MYTTIGAYLRFAICSPDMSQILIYMFVIRIYIIRKGIKECIEVLVPMRTGDRFPTFSVQKQFYKNKEKIFINALSEEKD